MKITAAAIADVLIIEPRVFSDDRGFFFESFNAAAFASATGFQPQFVQDNHSGSKRHVLRGLHYQIKQAQGKLVQVISGEIYDVAVDIRRRSQTFGKWVGHVLSEENRRQLWIPEGFAHGFLVISDHAEVLYKATDYWQPEHERCIAWNDPKLGINWPLRGEPVLSTRDRSGVTMQAAELFA